MAKKLSYREKIALLSEYNPCKTYKKGTRVVNDSKTYRALIDITTPEPWTSKHWKEIKYEECIGKVIGKQVKFEDIKVVPSAWYIWKPKDNEQIKLFKTYPYRAFLSCKDVTADMIPYVMFQSSEALSGEFANIAESVNKGVYIYCKAKPKKSIFVPMVMCLKESK